MNATETIRLVKTDKCPACEGSSRNRTIFKLDRFDVKGCRCGHRFIDPSLDDNSQMLIYQSSKDLKEINPALEHYYEYKTLKPEAVAYKEYLKAIKTMEALTAGRSLLEAGCGTGSLLNLAQERGWEVLGIDSSSDNIRAMSQAGIAGFCSSFLEYRTDDRFDAVVLWDLIEHLPTPRHYVLKAWELLKPGGLLVLATPHYPNFLSVLAGMIHGVTRGAISSPVRNLYMLEHTSYFSRKTLSNLIAENGFRVAKSWKTETDLERYQFSAQLKTALRLAFVIARCFGWQNRLNLIAQKCPE